LQHERGGVGQVEAALQQAAARLDAAHHQRADDHGERILARCERDEDARIAVPRKQ
jgi:hypothetical protein